jgi:hypothetical protein
MSPGSSKSSTTLFPLLNGSSLPHTSTNLRCDTLHHDTYEEADISSWLQTSLRSRASQQELDFLEENVNSATAAAMSDIMIDEPRAIQTTGTLRCVRHWNILLAKSGY